MSAFLNVCDGRVGSGEECWEQLCPVGRLVGGTCEAVHVLGEGGYTRGKARTLPALYHLTDLGMGLSVGKHPA